MLRRRIPEDIGTLNLGIDFTNAIRNGLVKIDYDHKPKHAKSRNKIDNEIGLRTGNGAAGEDSARHCAERGPKKQLADAGSTYRAKIAERELVLRDEIRKAQTTGNLEDAEKLEKQLTSEIARLREDCEAKKENCGLAS